MTVTELAQAVLWIEDRWGEDKVWKDPGKLAADFDNVSFGAVKDALWEIYRAGSVRAPRPGQLLAAAEQAQRRRIESGQDNPPMSDRVCRHRWSHVPMWDALVCAVCGDEKYHGSHCDQCDRGRFAGPAPEAVTVAAQSSLLNDDPDPL